MTDNDGKYGQKIEYDPIWKGPIQNIRFPTDRIWLIVFSIYMIIYIAASLFGFIAGDINKTTSPADYVGRECGIDKEVRNKPYLFYMNLKDLDRYNPNIEREPYSVCVSKCPTENFIYKRNSESLGRTKEKLICVTGVDVASISSFDQLDDLIKYKKCAGWYLKSTDIRGRCVNSTAWNGHTAETANQMQIDDIIRSITHEEGLNEYIAATKRAVAPAITAIILGGILALTFVLLLRWYALPFFYASICMYSVLLIGGIYYLTTLYVSKDTEEHSRNKYLYFLILLVVLFVILIIAVIYFRKKIYLACQLVKESSKAIIHLPVTLAFPIFPLILYITVAIFALTLFLSLLTITSPHYVIEKEGPGYLSYSSPYQNGSTCDPINFNKTCKANEEQCLPLHCRLAYTTTPIYVYLLHAINIFGFYWLWHFVSGLEYMILGGTFGTWYWTHDKSIVGSYTLVESTSTTFRYHLGTVAVGSLILAVVQMIRMILKALHDKLRESDHPFLQIFLCCIRYIFDIFEQILSFITYNSYIMCAIHGNSFCQSAKSSYHLIMRNLVNVVVVNEVADTLFMMAKILITSIITAGLLLYTNYVHDLSYTTVIIGALGTYGLSSLFFSVQSKAVDTVFLCFVEDSERNDGSDERPYYMSNKLRKLLEK